MTQRTFLLTVDLADQTCNGSVSEMAYWAEFLQIHIQTTFMDRYPNSILHTAIVAVPDPRTPFQKLVGAQQEDLIQFCYEGIRDLVNEDPREVTLSVLNGYDQEEIDAELKALAEIQQEREDAEEVLRACGQSVPPGDEDESDTQNLVDRDRES